MKINLNNENPNKYWIEIRFPEDMAKKKILNIENKIKILLADNLDIQYLNYNIDTLVSTWDDKGSRIW